MAITIDLPPAMAQEAQGYAVVDGTTLEGMVLRWLEEDLRRRREQERKSSDLMAKWRATVRKGRGRLSEPYKFNRADAYPEGEFA